MMELCAFWRCESCVILLVGFRWTSSGQSTERGVLEAQDGVVMGVVWPLSSGLASGPLTILNEHFWP